MNGSCRVLVVAPDPEVAASVVAWLGSQGHQTRLVTDFAAAKPELESRPPDLLVTEMKLGAFNGIHLAIRALGGGSTGTPTIVIGEPDTVLEAEARQQRARYLTRPLTEHSFNETAREMLEVVR